MAGFDLSGATALIGKYVLVESQRECDSAPDLYCIPVVGLVPPLAGVIEQPHFLAMVLLMPSRFPEELFWHNIRSLMLIEPGALASGRQLTPQVARYSRNWRKAERVELAYWPG